MSTPPQTCASLPQNNSPTEDLWLQSRSSDVQESQILHLTSCRNMKTYTVAPNLEISFRDSGEEACAPAHVAVMDI